MKIMDNFLNKVGVDKVMHFAISGWLTLILYTIFSNIIMSLMVVLFLGFIKEVADLGTSGFGRDDLIADALGVLVSVLVVRIF